MESNINALFIDIGGVLLTNGWDRNSRKAACDKFSLDYAEMDERHHLTFDTYEEGKLTLNEYLDRVVFYQPRSFTKDDFIQFMYAQSKPYPEMIDLIRKLKQKYCFKVAVVSNEGRELTEYRINKFELGEFVDFFISSCFVHLRKPDHDIFRMALDIAQVEPNEVIYIEDRPLFASEARSMGLRAIRHQGIEETRQALARAGFVED